MFMHKRISQISQNYLSFPFHYPHLSLSFFIFFLWSFRVKHYFTVNVYYNRQVRPVLVPLYGREHINIYNTCMRSKWINKYFILYCFTTLQYIDKSNYWNNLIITRYRVIISIMNMFQVNIMSRINFKGSSSWSILFSLQSQIRYLYV